MCGTHPSKEQYPFEHPLFDLRHNTALYSSGGAAGVTDYGPNAGKTVDSMQFGGDGYSYLTVTKDGYVKEYDVMYTGGSHDHMRQEYSTTSNGTQTTGSVTSFDANGNKVDKNNVAGDKWTEPDGTKGWKYEYTKPVTDEKGNVVGSEVGTFSLIQNPDGSSRLKGTVTTNTNDGTTTVKEIDSTHKGGKTHTTVSEKTTRADGSSTEKKTETETDDDCDADCMEVIEAGDDYTDRTASASTSSRPGTWPAWRPGSSGSARLHRTGVTPAVRSPSRRRPASAGPTAVVTRP